MCGPDRPRKNSISTESEVNEAAGARQSSCRSAWLALDTAPAIFQHEQPPPVPLRPTAGVPNWIDHRARIAHAKTMGIDSAVTLTGSHNWNAAGAANFEA
jgi:phosphatidylserine/phosphatidylglycerophosphate/cardiolipin synthase-like enzyme